MTSSRAILLFGKVIAKETLRDYVVDAGHPEGYADMLWTSYWRQRDLGLNRDATLSELYRICIKDRK